MVQEIDAKTLLAHVKQPDEWFGLRYNMNLYRGCTHGCIYCDSRSACYGIEHFHVVQAKRNAIDRLRDELPRKRQKGTVGFGSMSDPYVPAERGYRLTARALSVLAEHRFPAHIITKSDLVVRDADLLAEVGAVFATVSFSLTTADDALAGTLEPGAPAPSRRLAALRTLRERGIHAGVVLMPVLPLLTDDPATLADLVARAADHGAEYILASFGMTLRDRQRTYYYLQLDRHFPGLRAQYEARFGERYGCAARDADRRWAQFTELCTQHGLATRVPRYEPPPVPQQLPLF